MVRRLAGVQRGNGGSSQPRAGVQPPGSPGDAVMTVSNTKQAGTAREKPMAPREGAETSALAHGSSLSQREGARLGGVLGHHKLCEVPDSASPHTGPSRLGAEQGGGPCVQGWAQPDFWRVPCIPAWLNFSARCFLCFKRCLRGSRECLPFSVLPPLRHLSLSSSSCPACCRGRRPPSSFPTLLAALAPGLNSALPRECLQQRQIFSNTHVPLCPEQT